MNSELTHKETNIISPQETIIFIIQRRRKIAGKVVKSNENKSAEKHETNKLNKYFKDMRFILFFFCELLTITKNCLSIQQEIYFYPTFYPSTLSHINAVPRFFLR